MVAVAVAVMVAAAVVGKVVVAAAAGGKAAAVAAMAAAGTAVAAAWQGGHGGGWHGGGNRYYGSGYRGGWYGGGYRGWYGGWYGWPGGYSVAIGFPSYWGFWPYFYYPYNTPAYYPAAYTTNYPVYSYPSGNAWYVDSPGAGAEPYRGTTDSAVTTPLPSDAAHAPPPQTYRYYCPDAGYYPAVASCAKGWMRVVPDAGPPPPQ